MNEISLRSRHQWWRLLAAAAAIVAVIAAITVAAGRIGHHPKPAPAGDTSASALRTALIDLIQPGDPFPVALEPTSEGDPSSLADAIVAAKEFGLPVPVDPAVGAVLSAYLRSLPTDDASGEELATLWTVLRAATALNPGDAHAVTTYLGKLDLAGDAHDDAILQKSALVRRIGAIGTDAQWSPVDVAARAVVATVLARQCAQIRSLVSAGGLAGLGLAVETEQDITQRCTADERAPATAAVRTLTTAHSEDADDLSELAALVRAGDEPAALAQGSQMSEVATTMLTDDEASLAGSAAVACPTDDLRQAADLGSVTGIAAASIPAALSACLTRAIRWRGQLADVDSDPSALSTFLDFEGLRMLPGDASVGQTTAALTRSIDWSSPRLSDTDRLILAVSYDHTEVTPQLAGAVARSSTGATALGIALINAAAQLLGACPADVTSATRRWIDQAVGPSSQGVGTVWSLFAVSDAKVCLPPTDAIDLASVRQLVARTIAGLSPQPGDRGQADGLILAWLRRTASCVGLDAGPVGAASAVKGLEPTSFGGLFDAGELSTLGLFVDASMLTYPAGNCANPSWLTLWSRS